MRATSTVRLIHPQCKADRQHMVIYAGLALCCVTDYRHDQKRAPRSSTLPLGVVPDLPEVAA